MSIISRYLAYADAFELSYDDDDWSRIGEYFTENATYTGEPVANGRAAVLDKLKNAVDGFDRRMDSRKLEFQTPTQDGDSVQVGWQVTYTKAGCPDLVLSGTEIAEFEGDQIASLTDIMDPGVEQTIGEWMGAHGSKLEG